VTIGLRSTNPGWCNVHPERRTALQTSRVIRIVALALFCLFPLLSVVQLRDSDAPWRRVAEGVQPAVVVLHGEDGSERGCALVIQKRPLRAVTVGVPPEGVHTTTTSGNIAWRRTLVDDTGQFTILEARSNDASADDLPAVAALLDVEGTALRTGSVKAALVGPRQFDGESLWVGVLRPAATPAGQPLYRAGLMRRVRTAKSWVAGDAWAVGDERIDHRLRGAPFVDGSGHVVGLYHTHQGHQEDVLPIHVVCRSLVFLHLQAAQ
jgi:hypothetical protein